MTREIYIGVISCFAMLATLCQGANEFGMDLAETPGTMHVWRVGDGGLPSDSVTAIIQTRDGFLWIGTAAGLVHFDGIKFTAAPAPETREASLTGITALCEDSDGHLWIGTQANGLFQLARGRLEHYSKEQGLLDNNITSLAADAHGQVWIGCNFGLNLWDGRKFSSFTTRDGLSDEAVSGVNVARSGSVWITTRAGMCRYVNGRITPYVFQTDSQGRSPEYLGAYEDRRGNIWAFGDTYLINLAEGKRFNYFRGSEPTSMRIWSLCEGLDGRLWIGTSGRGLLCFEEDSIRPVILSEDRWAFAVRAIYEDREGNLWLGTSGGGLAQLRPQSVHVLRGGQGLPDAVPTSVALDADGKIYVGLQRGGLWMGEAGRFDRVGGGGVQLQNFVSSVCVGRDGTAWAGTLGNGLYGSHGGNEVHLTTADGLADNAVLAVCADAKNGVWASTAAGTLHRFSSSGAAHFGTADGLPGVPVTAMIATTEGGLWLGTQNGGLLREENGKFSSLSISGRFAGQPVVALFEAETNRLWIGTAGGGLGYWSNGVATSWTTNSGLPSDIVSCALEDRARNLWLATGAGICRVNFRDVRRSLGDPRIPLECKLVSSSKTISEPSAVFSGTRAALASDNRLWFATSEGLLNVDTRHLESEPLVIPVCIESAIVNGGTPIPLLGGDLWPPVATNGAPFKAPVDLRSLEVHFTALSFFAPGEIQFRHKLEGLDSVWNDDSGARFARYGRLFHGNYSLRVEARFPDGPWQEAGRTFDFVVPTPLAIQPWAIGLYVVSAIVLVAGTVRMISHRRLRNRLVRLEQQQSLERERMRIARDMHDEMGSKLTKISFLSEHVQMDTKPGEPLNDKIQSIAQASRDLLKTMDEIVWVVNPHNDTLENLTTYLSHYAVEYFQNTNIECELRLPPEIPQHPLSSEARHNLFLTFEETLNNVLKHSEASRVKVEMSVINTLEFELKVSDNGKGFDLAAATANGRSRGGRGGNGLKNMRQRLAAVGGDIVISSTPGAGTVVVICIRLSKTNTG